jgi:hypothetical protein
VLEVGFLGTSPPQPTESEKETRRKERSELSLDFLSQKLNSSVDLGL